MFWLHRKPDEVLDIFATLPGAIAVGEKLLRSVYVPGSRKDRVLLVSHVDTVFDDRSVPVMPVYNNGTISSGLKTMGIGADDRAGCAILWRLRGLGHSLLLTNSEEKGCQGSRAIVKDNPKLFDELNAHQFAIEFDRRGDSDLVFYSVGSPEFVKWCEGNFDGYTHAFGSFTDIGVLCDKMCGVNISVGYYDEHGSSERLVLREWQNTLATARKALSQNDIPRFDKPKVTHATSYATRYPRDVDNYSDYYTSGRPYTGSAGSSWLGNEKHTYASALSEPDLMVDVSDMVTCPWCSFMQYKPEVEANENKCCLCSKEV